MSLHTPLFHIVDVFAERRYTGNQLAVVFDKEGLSDEAMRLIAQETNFSETTFVRFAPESNGGYRVRIFTPTQEIPFAGHPILGTAWVIRRHIGSDDPNLVRLNLSTGQIPVTFERSKDGRELAWFLGPPVEPGPTCAPEQIASALHLSASDIDTRVPVQQFSAGVSTLIVPLRRLEALRRCRLDLEAFAPLAKAGFPSCVYVFCPETNRPENQLSARFFFAEHGVREDAATGSATAFLGVHLLMHEYYPWPTISLRIEQGYEINRPSLVMLRGRKVGNSYEVSVGGHVIPTIHGELI